MTKFSENQKRCTLFSKNTRMINYLSPLIHLPRRQFSVMKVSQIATLISQTSFAFYTKYILGITTYLK